MAQNNQKKSICDDSYLSNIYHMIVIDGTLV